MIHYQTNYFFIALLLMLLVNMFYSKQHFSISNRWFMRLIGIEILVLLLEALSLHYDYALDAPSRELNRVLHFIFYASTLCVPVLWLNYIDFKIFNSESRLKKRLYFSPYLIAGMILLIINLKTRWIYGFDETGRYRQETVGTLLFTLYFTLIIYSPLITIIKNRVRLETNTKIVTFVFVLLPNLGALLQIMYQDVMFIWNTVAIAILGIYIFLELNSVSSDSLTGLDNRKQMEEWLYYRTALAGRSGNGFSILMIDMDGFKSINDKYGHSEGDQALIHFSRILNQCFKHEDNISRFAGDEFLISLEATDEAQIKMIIERLQGKLKDFNDKGVKAYSLACSCGYSIYDPAAPSDYEVLIHEADMNMYKDKERKKGRRS